MFLSFDPHSDLKIMMWNEMNWIITFFYMMLVLYFFWVTPNRLVFYKNMIITIAKNQFSIALKTKKDGAPLMFCSIFLFFFLCNFLGLSPNVFTPSSHLNFDLVMSLSYWLGYFLFGWFCNYLKMFIHLVPLSTPPMLMSFMVIIEMISNIIRPLTLSIRLMANMVSGHILLNLVGNAMTVSTLWMNLILIFIEILLMSLEIGVCLIQAYVFCMLLSLYSDDSDHLSKNKIN
nr:ATP synthase F0 subunit 6 [Aptinothrips stylifer]